MTWKSTSDLRSCRHYICYSVGNFLNHCFGELYHWRIVVNFVIRYSLFSIVKRLFWRSRKDIRFVSNWSIQVCFNKWPQIEQSVYLLRSIWNLEMYTIFFYIPSHWRLECYNIQNVQIIFRKLVEIQVIRTDSQV